MSELDHWHPVLSSKLLKRQPVGIKLAGRELVVFRGPEGRIGVLDDCCVHRRMRLSKGMLDRGKLRCKYHGWTYDCDGHAESPGTPKLCVQADTYEASEQFGVVWVKSHDSDPKFPGLDDPAYFHVGTLFHQARAPLELVVDNFCEIEHTPTTHAIFGYALETMDQVQVRFETTPSSVRVINHGPPKPLGPVWRLLLGIGKDWVFNDDWTTYFSPVYSVYEHWWTDPTGKLESRVRWRLFIFFVPRDANETDIVTFIFTKVDMPMIPGRAKGIRPFRRTLVNSISHEVDLDVDILESLANKDPNIQGMKLSRFDRVLGLNRERIDRVYRGLDAGRVRLYAE